MGPSTLRPCTLSERTYGRDAAPGADMCNFALVKVPGSPGSSSVTLSKNGLLTTSIRELRKIMQEYLNMPSNDIFPRDGVDRIESKCAE